MFRDSEHFNVFRFQPSCIRSTAIFRHFCKEIMQLFKWTLNSTHPQQAGAGKVTFISVYFLSTPSFNLSGLCSDFFFFPFLFPFPNSNTEELKWLSVSDISINNKTIRWLQTSNQFISVLSITPLLNYSKATIYAFHNWLFLDYINLESLHIY